jgi:hypothetical protein
MSGNPDGLNGFGGITVGTTQVTIRNSDYQATIVSVE